MTLGNLHVYKSPFSEHVMERCSKNLQVPSVHSLRHRVGHCEIQKVELDEPLAWSIRAHLMTSIITAKTQFTYAYSTMTVLKKTLPVLTLTSRNIMFKPFCFYCVSLWQWMLGRLRISMFIPYVTVSANASMLTGHAMGLEHSRKAFKHGSAACVYFWNKERQMNVLKRIESQQEPEDLYWNVNKWYSYTGVSHLWRRPTAYMASVSKS